jgi:peptide/nickel transport system substrate-binding protein
MTKARLRRARHLAAPLLALSLLLPAAAPAAAADPVVLRVGTTQDLDASNPFNTYLVSGYEVFQLTYNLLVDFDKDAKPAPGFAESWTREPDKVVFKIRDGMKWSDGTPATSKDACYSWGLALDAIAAGENVGVGYLDPGIKDAGVTKVECPDDSTFIAYTTDQSDRIFQVYFPIIPAHIYGDKDYTQIGEDTFDPPLVGTGPYILQEWKTGQYARFTRNPEYWGPQGFEDEVVIQFFQNADTMVQALKAGEIDYARGVNPDQLKQLAADPAFTTVAGKANGWTQIAYNTYGTGTGKTIKDGGPSTTALLDQKFRDALGYAVDKKTLVDRVLGGFGDPGDTVVPPIIAEWHVTPDKPRTFDLELAKQKLEAAGYILDANGKRLDKEGKPISLRLVAPNTDDTYRKVPEFIKTWFGELGIGVTVEILDSTVVGNRVLPPEAGDEYKADYDMEVWGWAWNPDPSGNFDIFRCEQIGNTSDSQYCNPEFDKLYALQLTQSGEERAKTLAEMQNLIYDEAPYDVLFYDANLDAYRTDRFAGWQNMPADGTPLFTYGTLQYTLLTDATAQPSPTAAATEAPASAGPAATAAPATPAASADGGSAADTDSPSTTLLVVVIAAIVIIGIVFIWLVNSRRKKGGPDDDE